MSLSSETLFIRILFRPDKVNLFSNTISTLTFNGQMMPYGINLKLVSQSSGHKVL